MPTFAADYLKGIAEIAGQVNPDAIEDLADALDRLRSRAGRLFLLGAGGSYSTCSHAAADFRKLAGIDALAADNVSLLTAFINDGDWGSCFRDWLRSHKFLAKDMLMVVSVGGGSPNVSANLVEAMTYALARGAKVVGMVGRDGGATKSLADICIIVPPIAPALVTAYTESFHSVIFHLLVMHPKLLLTQPTWEGLQ